MSKDGDYEWLKTIECLKKTGMPLKDIRTFVLLSMERDGTIDKRLAMIRSRRESVVQQMAELQQDLDTLDFKC